MEHESCKGELSSFAEEQCAILTISPSHTLVKKVEDVGLLAHITLRTGLTSALSTSRQAKESIVLIGHGYHRCRSGPRSGPTLESRDS
jgi:hypothetical protein